MNNRIYSLLTWLRDPFGSKRLKNRHTEVRRQMIESKVRAEDTTKLVRRFPITRQVRVSPIEKTVLGNRKQPIREEQTP